MDIIGVEIDFNNIEDVKNLLCSQIDENTISLISEGFIFAGQTFSMSLSAQINWSNFPFLPESMFPITIMDKYDNVYILSFANKMNFWGSALAYKNSCLQAGTIKKNAVRSCLTLEELNIIAESM